MQDMAARFTGRKVAPDMTAVIPTNHMIYSAAKRLGLQLLQCFG